MAKATAFVQPVGVPRLTVMFRMLCQWKEWRPTSSYISSRLASGTSNGESSESASTVTSVDREAPSKVSDAHSEQRLGSRVVHGGGSSAKKTNSWKPGAIKGGEDKILKVLPGSGEPKALKFRLGKKHVTTESLRGKSLHNEDLLESEHDVKLSGSIGDLPKNLDDDSDTNEETYRLVQSLRKKLSLSDKDQSLYSNSLPSVFGTSVGGARQAAKTIHRAGFKKSEVSSVLPRFPNILDINYDNVARVYKVLQKAYKMNRNWLQGLMRRHPYLFTLEEGVIRERMDAMIEFGLHPREIGEGSYLHSYIVRCTPKMLVHTCILHVYQSSRKVGEGVVWVVFMTTSKAHHSEVLRNYNFLKCA